MITFTNPKFQEFIEVIDFSFNLVDALKAAKANDGVVDFKDWALLFPLIGDAGVAYQGIEETLSAWKAGPQEDRDLVIAHFNEKFTLENKVTEAKVEKAILAATLVLELFMD